MLVPAPSLSKKTRTRDAHPLCAAATLVLVAQLGLPAATAPMEESVAEFQRLDELTRLVQRHYFRPVTRQDLWAGAYRGMVEQLAGRNRFIPEHRHVRSEGPRRVGFGFDWRYDAEREAAVVSRVLPDSPADRAGLVPGDRLVAVGDHQLVGLPGAALRERLADLPDEISIRLRHVDGSEATASLVRAALDDRGLGQVAMVDLANGVGLVQITRFLAAAEGTDGGTAAAFRAAVDGLVTEGLRALVLDLRGNPGGDLMTAVAVADAFLDAAPDGGTVIASQESRHAEHQAVFKATSTDTYPRWPLVVLVDEHTASSAELLAAALRDHRRALLIGEPTQGKNTLQQTFVLAAGDAVSLTVAAFRTPLGRDLSGRGLSPDVSVATDPAGVLARARHRRGEASTAPADPAIARARDVLVGMLLHQSGFGF